VGLIYLDSCLIIYLVEDHPIWGAAVARVLSQGGSVRFVLSPLAVMECLVGPVKNGDTELYREYLLFFEQNAAIDMPESVYLEAAELRGRFGLRTPDALHLACARHHRCEALWTNDGRLGRASGGLARNILQPTS
jgi:predicted nucleic acid-binding protein